MRAFGPSPVKAELFLIAVAALCLAGVAVVLIMQRAAPPTTTAASSEQEEPVSRPLPGAPRTFQP